MEGKDQLIIHIKEWLKIDNELIKLKNEVKERNTKKKLLTEQLVNVMKENNIDCFNINGGEVLYKKNIVKKPINSKMLLTTLQTYYKDNLEMAQEITSHILNNREEVMKETIKRKIDK
jgi:hypothetical protein